MNNLYKAYKEIFATKKIWKYYNRLNVNEFPLISEDAAWNFIQEYYKAGDKNIVFEDTFKRTTQRNLHSVSVFFLGLLLSDFIIGKEYKDKMSPDIRYLWFIASLYHDYSFTIEDEKNVLTKCTNLQEVYKEFNVKYIVLDDIKSPIYEKKLIESYFKYRIEKCKKLDHGIVGGILLYDRLRKNYDIAYEKHAELNPESSKECFVHNDLLWSTSQYDFFSELADTIIAHNIWFCPKGQEEIYTKYGLKDLIIKDKADENKKHKREYNPFLFLLVMADTIEPMKKFEKYSTQELLEKIKIETNTDAVLIEVLDDKLDYQKWFGSIKGLEEWMHVEVEELKNRLKITFK